MNNMIGSAGLWGIGNWDIRLGVSRSARPFALDAPLPAEPLRLSEILARVNDNPDGVSINRADVDLSAIVVTAAKGKQKPIYSLLIGSHALSKCSANIFGRGRKLIRLLCIQT